MKPFKIRTHTNEKVTIIAQNQNRFLAVYDDMSMDWIDNIQFCLFGWGEDKK